MPRKEPRDYKAERAAYDGKPAVRERNAARTKIRRELIADGRVARGDGTHIDHKVPLTKGGANNKANVRVVSAKKNLKKGNR